MDLTTTKAKIMNKILVLEHRLLESSSKSMKIFQGSKHMSVFMAVQPPTFQKSLKRLENQIYT